MPPTHTLYQPQQCTDPTTNTLHCYYCAGAVPGLTLPATPAQHASVLVKRPWFCHQADRQRGHSPPEAAVAWGKPSHPSRRSAPCVQRCCSCMRCATAMPHCALGLAQLFIDWKLIRNCYLQQLLPWLIVVLGQACSGLKGFITACWAALANTVSI